MSLTNIFDTWYLADGSLLTGTCVATPTPSPGIVYAGQSSIVAAPVTFQVVNGLVNVNLQANDTAQPAGTTYSVYVYVGRGKSFTETWFVPSSTQPLALAAVRGVAQGLPRSLVFFPATTTWFIPAANLGIQTFIPFVLTYNLAGQQILGTVKRNSSTGDVTVYWAVPQAGTVQFLLTGKQYTQDFVLGSPASSITITAAQAGLTNIAAVEVLDTDGQYVIEGVQINLAIVASSPATPQLSAAQNQPSFLPFASNLAGAFGSVTFSFITPQSGTIVLLGS